MHSLCLHFISAIESSLKVKCLLAVEELIRGIHFNSQGPTALLHAPDYEHKILLVSGSSASSPVKKTTLDCVATCWRMVCSVGLRTVGSPGACPDITIKKMRQNAVIVV